MPLDSDLLDPTVDIPDYLQGVYADIASQKGGKSAKAQTYMSLAKQGVSPEDVLAKSYDEQENRRVEQMRSMVQPQYDIRTDPNFFFDAHSVNIQDPSQGFMNGGAQDINSLNPVPIVTAEQIDTTKLDAIRKQIDDIFSKPHPIWEGSPMPQPTSSQALLTGLAMAFAPPNQSGQILNALTGNLQAIRQRNDVIHQLWQQTQDANEKYQLESLMKQAVIEESRGMHNATLRQQASIANAGNVVKTNAETGKDTRLATKEAGMNQRLAAREGSQMVRLQAKMAHEDNKKGQEILSEFRGRKEILTEIHPDWTIDQIEEKAAEYVNAKSEWQILSNASKKLDNTYKQKTLSDRIATVHQELQNKKYMGLYTQARTKYTQELTKYIPQNEAFKWASLLALMDFRDRSLSDKQSAYNERDNRRDLDILEKGYNAAQEQLSDVKTQLATGVDFDGHIFNPNDTNDKTTKQLTNLKKLYEGISKEAELKLIEAERSAKAKQEFNKERTKRPSVFGKGRPKPMQGNIPVDPTGSNYERTPESVGQGILDKLGGNMNPFLEGVHA